MSYLPRAISPKILEAQPFFPVTIITGPRQTGKTTLCRHLFPDYEYVNFENQDTRNRALTDISAFIESCGKHVIMDEVQRVPEIMSAIQVNVDADRERRYILTGSNHFTLLNTSYQSLAGRAVMFTLMPFAFNEMPREELQANTDELLFRGFYPGVVANGVPPYMFYRSYYDTYIERDIRQLSQIQTLDLFQTFIRLCAGRTGTEFRPSALSSEVGVSAPTIQNWLSLLKASYIVYTVSPYFNNIRKRLTKTPKIYFYDSGLLCYLLGIEESHQLATHPLRGAIFENVAMTQFMKKRYNAAKDPNINFYRESSGREVDIVVTHPSGVSLYEVKSSKTFHESFVGGIDYAKNVIPYVNNASVIYDGATMPPLIYNVRDIDKIEA